MSGGTWGYQQHKIEEKAEILGSEIRQILLAVAATEKIVDWSEAGDTSRHTAEIKLYDLWVKTFNDLYPDW